MTQTDFAEAVHVSFALSNGCVNAIFEERPKSCTGKEGSKL